VPSKASLAKAAKLRRGVKRSERPLAKHLPVAATKDLLLTLETHHLILALHCCLLLMALESVLNPLEPHLLSTKAVHVGPGPFCAGKKSTVLGNLCLLRRGRRLRRHLRLRSLHWLSHLGDSRSLLWGRRCRRSRDGGVSPDSAVVRITKCPEAKVGEKVRGRLCAAQDLRQHSTAH
jgi:hypothetical protein